MKRDSEGPMGAAPCDAPPTQTAPAGALSKGLRWVLERSSEPGEFDVAFRVATTVASVTPGPR